MPFFKSNTFRSNAQKYFYRLVESYLNLYILPKNKVVEVDPFPLFLVEPSFQSKYIFRNARDKTLETPLEEGGRVGGDHVLSQDEVCMFDPDYIVVGGVIHIERNIQGLLSDVIRMCRPDTRVIITYYSALWRPFFYIGSLLGLRNKHEELNWLAHEDIQNLLELESFQLIRLDSKILVPIYIPILSNFFNRYLAPLPFFRNFCLLNIVVARPILGDLNKALPSVSIVVPARNESGNIDQIIDRIPMMGPADEIIFVEGNSTDDTWEKIVAAKAKYDLNRRIVIAKQDGKGKGDAVRKGFSLAKNEILMILDADMTVSPDDLPKFYMAIRGGKGEFINGTRLVYPMEKGAMKFFNLVGNKFFAMAFSYVIGQKFKDTLCGTKVLTRDNYLKLAANRSYFGNFDPFGDFDLIFGSARLCLKIVEVPICYQERTYGETNISRWRHGMVLLWMLFFSAKKFKFL